MYKRTKYIILITLLVLVIQTCTISVLSPNNADGKKGEGKGKRKGEAIIGVYSDNQCIDPLSSINWGILELGSSKNKICYLKNEGNTDLFLSLKTSNWNPKNAFKDITINWDYGGQSLNPDETIQVSLVLSISEKTDFTYFSVDIIIIGS